MKYLLLLLIILFVFRKYLTTNPIEKFNGTGALTQLYAKGPQDSYLNGNVTVAYDYTDGLYVGKYPYYQWVFNSGI